MISGPVYPQTREGLRELLERHLDEVERGLTVVECDLELERDLLVDLLASDASGRPVFVFIATHEDGHELPARLLGVRAWLHDSGIGLLGRFFAAGGIDYRRPARFVVIGTEIRPWVLAQLGELRSLGVEVFRVAALRARGQVMVGAVPLHAADAPAPRVDVPGPAPRAQRRPGVEFADLMKRIDPDLIVSGDADSRRFSVSGCELAELRIHGDAATVFIPADELLEPSDENAEASSPLGFELGSAADCREVADRVMRRYVTAVRGERAPVAAAAGAPAPNGDTISLDRLRDAVDDARLSSEEYSILGESETSED